MRGDKQEQILRVLLVSTDVLSKNELSKQAGCSRQWVILFLKELERKKFIRNTKIINKKKLLQYWISISKKPRKFRSYMIKEPLKLLKKTKLEYALTTYQAENIVQHYLFPSRIDLYIKKIDLEKWHKFLTKNGLYGKGNVKIISADKDVMYGKRIINKLSIVSIPQLIVDLIKEGGTCREAGEILLEKM